MYDVLSSATLAQTLDQHSVPMFVLEQTEASAPFRFVYLNDRLEQVLLCNRWDIIGMSLADAIPSDEAPIAQRRMAYCVEKQKIMRFSDTFSLTKDRLVWDTTLQPILLADGRRRVVATCIQLNTTETKQAQVHALEDIQYFSSLADLQLQNLITMFETTYPQELFKLDAEQRLARLGGMCRTVQVAVAEIRKTVRSAKAIRQTDNVDTFETTSVQTRTAIARAGTMKELSDLSAE